MPLFPRATGPNVRTPKTVRCDTCGLPHMTCLCSEIAPIATRTKLVVVMHRVEGMKTTNTGKLATFALSNAVLAVSGAFARPSPFEETRVVSRLGDAPMPPGKRLLLFPGSNARSLDSIPRDDEPFVLIVPDGSWSQARKLTQHPDVSTDAELVALPPILESRYGLRRKPFEGGACTLEAVALALGILESRKVEEHLLGVLDRFVALHLEMRRLGATRFIEERSGPC